MGKLTQDINESVAGVVAFLCRNPTVFVSETDIHVLMMRELMKIPALDPDRLLHATSLSIGQNQYRLPSKSKYATMLVHKEYGHNTGRGERSDIVIFDPSDVAVIDDPINLKAGRKYLKPSYIFEFGTEKAAGTVEKFEEHMRSDLRKLSGAREAGYLIHIQRTYARSRLGTKTLDAHRAKYEAYRDRAMNVWGATRMKERFRLVIVFVEIGVPSRRVAHKLWVFDPLSCTWEADVRLDEGERKTRSLLDAQGGRDPRVQKGQPC
jgi:hypothetical protein